MDIFEPDRIRYFLWNLLCYEVALFFIALPLSLASQATSGYGLDLASLKWILPIAIIIAPMASLFSTARGAKFIAIVVLDEIIAGPSVWVHDAVRFNLKALNTEKSRRQNVLQRIFGYRLIVSTSGEKILFFERVFDKNQVAEILKVIGCARSGIA